MNELCQSWNLFYILLIYILIYWSAIIWFEICEKVPLLEFVFVYTSILVLVLHKNCTYVKSCLKMIPFCLFFFSPQNYNYLYHAGVLKRLTPDLLSEPCF